MTSIELEIDEKSRVGSAFMARVAREIRRALLSEKAHRKITQQAIADAIGTSRAVVNREISGVENLGARRIAELLWAIGWEPHFEAREVSRGDNQIIKPKKPLSLMKGQPKRFQQLTKTESSAQTATA